MILLLLFYDLISIADDDIDFPQTSAMLLYRLRQGRSSSERGMVIPVAKKISDETRLLKEVIRDLSCDDPEARRKALDAVMVFAWKPGWRPAEFISLGGVPALVGRLAEEDEKARVQAVEAVEHLAELGAAPELMKEGALPLLERMASGDQYEQIRMVAGRAVAKIRGRVKG
jgi:hypothetical protein